MAVGKTKAAVAERRAEIKRLTAAGYRQSEIGARLGMNTQVVANLQHRLGIASVEVMFGRSRRIDVNRVMAGIVAGVSVPQTSIDLLNGNWGQLDRDMLAGWVESLNESIATLQKMRANLRKELDERSQ